MVDILGDSLCLAKTAETPYSKLGGFLCQKQTRFLIKQLNFQINITKLPEKEVSDCKICINEGTVQDKKGCDWMQCRRKVVARSNSDKSDMEYTDCTNDCPGSIKRRRCKCE